MMGAWLLHMLLLFHPYYVNVVELDYNAAEKNMEISVRIFTDDLEKTLRQNYPGTKVDLIQPASKPAMDSLLKKYISSKLAVALNSKACAMQYVGYEQVEESIWTYFEIPYALPVKKVQLHNSLLYEYKKEQINMQHVVVNGKRQSYKIDNPKADVSFDF